MTALVRTLISRILLVLILIIWFIPLFIIFCMPMKMRLSSRWAYRVIHGLYSAILRCAMIPITYSGLDNIPQEPVIFVANHQSSLDIPLVGWLARDIPHLWFARHELMESWLLRFILPKLSIVVNVNDPRKAMRSLLQVKNLLNGHYSHLMIFPEGSRFTDGSVHEFFGGFVTLAKKMGRAIVPVRIFNANKVYPPNTFLIEWHPIIIVIGKPLRKEEQESDDAFKLRVYQWFIEQKEG